MGDVADDAVTVSRFCSQLLLKARFADPMSGIDGQADDFGSILLRPQRTFGNPFREKLVIYASLFQPPTAAVGHQHGRFQEQEALFRFNEVDSALLTIADDGFTVLIGRVAEDGQGESTLTMLAGMARACVAPTFAEDGLNVFDEADFVDRINATHHDFDDAICLTNGDRDLGRAIL